MSDGDMHPEQMQIWEKLYSMLANEDTEGYAKLVNIFWDERPGKLLPGEYEYRAEAIIEIANQVLNQGVG